MAHTGEAMVNELLERATKVQVVTGKITENYPDAELNPASSDEEFEITLNGGILCVGSKGCDPYIFYPLASVRKLSVEGNIANVEIR